MNNTNIGQGDFAGGYDFGDGFTNLNPNDIADVSVLKGGNATALYGHLGANGVIVINTKKGRSDKVEVDINSAVSFEDVLVSPKFSKPIWTRNL